MNDPYESLISSGNYSFLYTPTSIPTNETEEYFNEEYVGCLCTDICRADCPCYSRTGTIYEDGRIVQINDMPSYECNANCSCASKCSLKLVQFGPNSNMDIRWTEKKGYGLFAKSRIPKDSFICEYAGEIIGKNEAELRYHNRAVVGESNYIFWAREHFGDKTIETIIDPTSIGNIGRFANHSCKPNCNLLLIRIDCAYPKVCLFSNRIIDAEQEITFDYGSCESVQPSLIENPCHCEEANCKGKLTEDL
ncbi:PREDICTED: probable histone-lysine N-methyltransferase set-23 [Nicrophorus vespilloides]|uniref:Probable histone-lysine N-methyltransferase set-23 n=1 Tax=Nicrophorus vespilloides TaxID=110193 RepID=A0ABM1MNU5_NICVS|nr:PREDICTED: probable histone-lysine N-methyltransferase set-23 [Nicrophorus vespilloides]